MRIAVEDLKLDRLNIDQRPTARQPICANRSCSASAVCGRPAGSFDSAAITSASSAGGTSGLRRRGLGAVSGRLDAVRIGHAARRLAAPHLPARSMPARSLPARRLPARQRPREVAAPAAGQAPEVDEAVHALSVAQRAQLLQALAVGAGDEVLERGRQLGQQVQSELAHRSRA